MRIAYVEDNPTNLALVERVASMNRHAVVSYTEGEIALLELQKERFDLILMDVELAGDMGGLEVVRKLRATGLQTPIIAVTAYAMIGDRDKCIEAGCTDYLSKPLPIPQLIALLDRYDEITKEPVTLVTKPAALVPLASEPAPVQPPTAAQPPAATAQPSTPASTAAATLAPVPTPTPTPAPPVSATKPDEVPVPVEAAKPAKQDEVTTPKPTT